MSVLDNGRASTPRGRVQKEVSPKLGSATKFCYRIEIIIWISLQSLLRVIFIYARLQIEMPRKRNALTHQIREGFPRGKSPMKTCSSSAEIPFVSAHV